MALPVSSSTVIIGAVAGVAFYDSRKEGNVRKKVGDERRYTRQDVYDSLGPIGKCWFRVKRMNIGILLKIVATWIITIPCNGAICAGVYSLMVAIWG